LCRPGDYGSWQRHPAPKGRFTCATSTSCASRSRSWRFPPRAAGEHDQDADSAQGPQRLEVGHIFKSHQVLREIRRVYTDDRSNPPMVRVATAWHQRTLQRDQQSHASDGIVGPASAPFHVSYVCWITRCPRRWTWRKKLAPPRKGRCRRAGRRRAERPGVKFKDADLIGIPLASRSAGQGTQEGIIEIEVARAKRVVKVTPPSESCVAQSGGGVGPGMMWRRTSRTPAAPAQS